MLAVTLGDDGTFPNSRLPLLLYRQALLVPERELAATVEELFGANGWQGSWRNGIYPYHHYHSTAHEVLPPKSSCAGRAASFRRFIPAM